jgi:surface antigen
MDLGVGSGGHLLRGTRKLLSIVVGCGALMSIGITSIPAGHATTSQTSATQARRAQLLAELAALAPAKNSAAAALLAAETAFNSEQALLLAAQQRLASLNARLLALNGQIADDEATIVQAKQQLADLTRQSYESTTTDSWVAAVLSARSFSQAMDRLTSTSHVAEQVQVLQTSVRDKEQAIRNERAEIASDAAASLALEAQLAQESNALSALVNQRNLALQAATGPERAIEVQIANLDQRTAMMSAPPPRGANSGSCGNHFAYGQCTWYVATRRCIPWLGNADQWVGNAARMGYPEGHMPQVGAVVSFWPGGDGASSVGHVGYVEVVGPASGVPAGYFKFSEMNYAGWDRVDYRVLPDNSSGIQAFIYNK